MKTAFPVSNVQEEPEAAGVETERTLRGRYSCRLFQTQRQDSHIHFNFTRFRESPTPEGMEEINTKARCLVSSSTKMQTVSQWVLLRCHSLLL